MLEGTSSFARFKAVSNHQHEIGADRRVSAEIVMAEAGGSAFEIDDGYARRVGLHPPDFFLGGVGSAPLQRATTSETTTISLPSNSPHCEYGSDLMSR